MTNQNDTQDEAERLAINKIAGDVNLLTKIHCLEIPEVALALKKAYRAGVASPETMSRFLHETRMAESGKSLRRHYEKMFQDHNDNHDRELAAEKQKALKLVEALKYYRGIVKGTWGYDGIIAAKYDNAISDYSTDSGDGVG